MGNIGKPNAIKLAFWVRWLWGFVLALGLPWLKNLLLGKSPEWWLSGCFSVEFGASGLGWPRLFQKLGMQLDTEPTNYRISRTNQQATSSDNPGEVGSCLQYTWTMVQKYSAWTLFFPSLPWWSSKSLPGIDGRSRCDFGKRSPIPFGRPFQEIKHDKSMEHPLLIVEMWRWDVAMICHDHPAGAALFVLRRLFKSRATKPAVMKEVQTDVGS